MTKPERDALSRKLTWVTYRQALTALGTIMSLGYFFHTKVNEVTTSIKEIQVKQQFQDRDVTFIKSDMSIMKTDVSAIKEQQKEIYDELKRK